MSAKLPSSQPHTYTIAEYSKLNVGTLLFGPCIAVAVYLYCLPDSERNHIFSLENLTSPSRYSLHWTIDLPLAAGFLGLMDYQMVRIFLLKKKFISARSGQLVVGDFRNVALGSLRLGDASIRAGIMGDRLTIPTSNGKNFVLECWLAGVTGTELLKRIREAAERDS